MSIFKKTYLYKDLILNLKPKKGNPPPNDTLIFGKTFSDHMIECNYTIQNGWEKPIIKPYQNLSLSPANSSLHYAIECFEGMKAYSSADGKKHFLYRPYKNAERFNASCKRSGLPQQDINEFIKLLAKLVEVDKHWIPKQKGYSLYLRPTMISNDDSLGVSPPTKSKFFVIASPVGPYFKGGFTPVSLLADENFTRAFPGGAGNTKLGSNYAPTIYPLLLAKEKGYDQNLWLFGEKKNLAEVGAMNIFVHWINGKGEEELMTPKLDGTILPGVTRDSIIEICSKDWGMNVNNNSSLSIFDLIKAQEEGRVIEIFGAGTAAVVCPVKKIGFRGKDFIFPTPSDGLSSKLFNHILSIQYGEIKGHPYVVEVEGLLKKASSCCKC